jgi:Rad3-related DNA helicase
MEDAVRDIDSILKDHPNERGVIHTTSYDILNYIKEHCKEARRLVPYQGTVEKVKLIKGLSELPKNAVIIGPSLTQGVDLHNDLARFSIIVKLSYPNIGAALWRKRFQRKRFIYWAEAANVLEQAAGRATRHIADQSVTYVLDDRADKFIKQPSTRKYFSDEFLSRIEAGKV